MRAVVFEADGVVVVADAGRSRPPVSDILALSDGRFGFKVAHPATGTRVSTISYQDVKAQREHAERAERLRLGLREPGGRLVEQQQGRLAREDAGDIHGATASGGQLGQGRVGVRLETEQVDEPVDDTRDLAPARPW